MTTRRIDCPDSAHLLALADEVLHPLDAARVDAHIMQCRQCAGEIARLRESLSYVHEFWNQALPHEALAARSRTLQAAPQSASGRSLQHLRVAIVGLAAGLVTWLWLPPDPGRTLGPTTLAARPKATGAAEVANRVHEAIAASPRLDELLAQVELAGAAGRALEVAELLLEDPASAELARTQLEFVIGHYPAAPAALRARTLLRKNWEIRG